LTFEIQNENPNNIGVHQAPDLRFAIFEVAIKPRILERTIGDAYFWMDCRRGAVISAARQSEKCLSLSLAALPLKKTTPRIPGSFSIKAL
jgi:hypothetical protein